MRIYKRATNKRVCAPSRPQPHNNMVWYLPLISISSCLSLHTHLSSIPYRSYPFTLITLISTQHVKHVGKANCGRSPFICCCCCCCRWCFIIIIIINIRGSSDDGIVTSRGLGALFSFSRTAHRTKSLFGGTSDKEC